MKDKSTIQKWFTVTGILMCVCNSLYILCKLKMYEVLLYVVCWDAASDCSGDHAKTQKKPLSVLVSS